MNGSRTISAYFEEDHDRLDELFTSFQSLKGSDFPGAKAAFEKFKIGLQRHIAWEEDVLFPLWEEKTGMSDGGPTFVMRAEHRQIGERLNAIHAQVAEGSPDSDPDEAALLQLLGAHNMKEERVLYPAIDQVTTPDECRDVFTKLDQIPVERYGVFSGARQP